MIEGGTPLLLKGLALRSEIVELPLGAFSVTVNHCDAKGDCVDACLVNVMIRDDAGRCTVVNDALCFGCMACLAQCKDGGIQVLPSGSSSLHVEELLR